MMENYGRERTSNEIKKGMGEGFGYVVRKGDEQYGGSVFEDVGNKLEEKKIKGGRE